MKAFQDYYPDDISHCYGCGRLNEHGLQIKSYWDGEESVAKLVPNENYIAIPGFVYGGLIASLIDCHSTGTAAAAKYREQGRKMDTKPALRYVTASLKVDFLAPTPLGVELEIRGRVVEIGEKKVIVEAKVLAENTLCAKGKVVAVLMPKTMLNIQLNVEKEIEEQGIPLIGGMSGHPSMGSFIEKGYQVITF